RYTPPGLRSSGGSRCLDAHPGLVPALSGGIRITPHAAQEQSMLSKTLLLTRFEPFGDRALNPSEQVVRYMEQSSLPGVRLHTAVLPVSRHEGPAALLHALEETRPDAVICLGLAAGIAAIRLERVAVNLLDFPTADNS